MRVLLANKFFFKKGGSEYCFFNTKELLESKGHQVSLFSMQDERNIPSRFDPLFVSHVDFNSQSSKWNRIKEAMRIIYSFEARKKIKVLLDRYQPDLVHVHNIHHQITPSIFKPIYKYNLPLVMTLHDYKFVCPVYTMYREDHVCEKCKNGKYYWCLINRCTKESYLKSATNTLEMYLHNKILKSYKFVDVFISPSRFLREKYLKMGFRGDIVHLPNFIDLEEFIPFYDSPGKIFVYFGRLSYEKGLITLLKAAKGKKFLLNIIGEGPLKEDLLERINKDKLSNVRFMGYKTGKSLYDEIRKSLAVIIPSEWYENNPRSVIEAFAMGKPVVGARIGGIPELVKDYETGLTFEPGNPKDLEEKVVFIKNNQDTAKEMGINARQFVEENLSSEIHYQKLIQIYQKALEKHNTKK